MTCDASIIVPTRNRADILEQSLPLMLAQDVGSQSYEIVVVSDGFEDPTAEVIGSLNSSMIKFAELDKPSGPAAARNRAISMADGRILVFLDDDSLIRSDFLGLHLAHHGDEIRNLIVTGPIIDVNHVPDFNSTARAGWRDRHWNPFPTGNASVQKSLVEDVGGFDESFKKYGWEDPELYARLEKAGIAKKFDFGAPIYHYKPHAETASLSARLKLEHMRGENGAMFYEKHPTWAVAFQTKQLSLFSALDKLADRVFGLQDKVQAAIDNGYEPDSEFVRTLMILHAEIESGRRHRR